MKYTQRLVTNIYTYSRNSDPENPAGSQRCQKNKWKELEFEVKGTGRGSHWNQNRKSENTEPEQELMVRGGILFCYAACCPAFQASEYGGGRVWGSRAFCNFLSSSWFSPPSFPVAQLSLSQFLVAALWIGFWMWLSCSRGATMLLWSALLSSRGGGWSCMSTLPMGLPDFQRLLMNHSSRVAAVSTQTTIEVPTSRGSRWSVQVGGRMSRSAELHDFAI